MTDYERQKLMWVSKELKNRIFNKVLACLDEAQRKFGVEKVTLIPEVRYNTKGTAGGKACWNNGKPYIDINPILLNQHTEEVVNRTVPHEVAHIVVYELYGEGSRKYSFQSYGRRRRREVAPHGAEWQHVMRVFGLEPDRCHNMDVSAVYAFRQRAKTLFRYRCNCQTFDLTIIRHNRISVHGKTFSCRRCKGKLVFDKMVMV